MVSSDKTEILVVASVDGRILMRKIAIIGEMLQANDEIVLCSESISSSTSFGFVTKSYLYICDDSGMTLIDLKYGSKISCKNNDAISTGSELSYIEELSKLVVKSTSNSLLVMPLVLPGLSLSNCLMNRSKQNAYSRETQFSPSIKVKVNKQLKRELKEFAYLSPSLTSVNDEGFLANLVHLTWDLDSDDRNALVDKMLKNNKFDLLCELFSKFNPEENAIFRVLDFLLNMDDMILFNETGFELLKRLFCCNYCESKFCAYLAKLSPRNIVKLMRMIEQWAGSHMVEDRNHIIRLLTCIVDSKVTSILMSRELQETLSNLTRIVSNDIDFCSSVDQISSFLSVICSKTSKCLERSGYGGVNQYAVEILR